MQSEVRRDEEKLPTTVGDYKVCVCFGTLTQFAHFENLTKHLGQLDTAAAKWTLVLVFSTAVLQDDLQRGQIRNHKAARNILVWHERVVTRVPFLATRWQR